MPRKKPFSGKQKRKQLQETRNRKQDGPKYLAHSRLDQDTDENDETSDTVAKSENDNANDGMFQKKKGGCTDFEKLPIQKINKQPDKLKDPFTAISNSFKMHFFKESDEVVERKKKEAMKPIKPIDQSYLEYKVEDVYPQKTNLDFPKRPPWNYRLTKDALEAQEHKYFKEYVSTILSQPRVQDLSHFELNLETWRQLWRVLEISDILLIIADIRYPVLHIPPSLIRHILHELHKSVVIILNKLDFVPPMLAISWKRYLQDAFPGIHIVFFSTYPKQLQNDESDLNFDPSAAIHRRVLRRVQNPIGPSEILDVCKGLVDDKVDLTSWEDKLKEEGFNLQKTLGQTEQEIPSESGAVQSEDRESSRVDQCGSDVTVDDDWDWRIVGGHTQKFKNGILTIGCIGYPNVGKSSVLNSLVGQKVVSVSQTPGHTKHLQTIFLTSTVRLCDCPGLVFPSMVPKSLQVVGGIFPVAHVREPYSIVGYLAKRINLQELLRLRPISPSPKKFDKNTGEFLWSAFDICESSAVKNGFTTSKAGRPDIYRAANRILRMAVSGQICLCFRPPNYTSAYQESLANDPEVLALCTMMRRKQPKRKDVNQTQESEHETIQGLPQVDEEDEEEDDTPSALMSANVFELCRELEEDNDNEEGDGDCKKDGDDEDQ